MPALIELAQEGHQYSGFLVVQPIADGVLNRGPVDGPHAVQERAPGRLDPDDLAPAVSGAGLTAHNAFCLQSIDQSQYVKVARWGTCRTWTLNHAFTAAADDRLSSPSQNQE
ncbi:hypothetical protein [Nitrosospira sp. NpAV]|uniref:hypothetical protein n=1 Tax=Nitrosospira sp. NpAV TaxID=58133 RepID=UPI0005A27958|nr:hypothetical protein [Nitrosospira sp. NpAV]KIO48549.1 hypothetical protein SQ11_11045 [Nitrosospira sp. NpAV]